MLTASIDNRKNREEKIKTKWLTCLVFPWLTELSWYKIIDNTITKVKFFNSYWSNGKGDLKV